MLHCFSNCKQRWHCRTKGSQFLAHFCGSEKACNIPIVLRAYMFIPPLHYHMLISCPSTTNWTFSLELYDVVHEHINGEHLYLSAMMHGEQAVSMKIHFDRVYSIFGGWLPQMLKSWSLYNYSKQINTNYKTVICDQRVVGSTLMKSLTLLGLELSIYHSWYITFPDDLRRAMPPPWEEIQKTQRK